MNDAFAFLLLLSVIFLFIAIILWVILWFKKKSLKLIELITILLALFVIIFFNASGLSSSPSKTSFSQEDNWSNSKDEAQTDDDSEDDAESSTNSSSNENHESNQNDPHSVTNGSSSENNSNKGSNNKIYGQLTAKGENLSDGAYKDNNLNYVTYGVNSDMSINVVKEDFSDLPLDPKLDAHAINEHVHDFMEDDASKAPTISDEDSSYYSEIIDKSYQVHFEKNDKGEIINIKIFKQDA